MYIFKYKITCNKWTNWEITIPFESIQEILQYYNIYNTLEDKNYVLLVYII